MMVGRQAFPIRKVTFQGRAVKLREGIPRYLFILFILLQYRAPQLHLQGLTFQERIDQQMDVTCWMCFSLFFPVKGLHVFFSKRPCWNLRRIGFFANLPRVFPEKKKVFMFTPKFGGDEPILTSIFFNGFGSTTNKLSLTPGFLFEDEIVLLNWSPLLEDMLLVFLGPIFETCTPPKINSKFPSQ